MEAREFMDRLASQAAPEDEVLVVARQYPNGVPSYDWSQMPRLDAMTHFCVGMVRKQPTGPKLSRTNEMFTGAIALVLDDIGETKRLKDKVTGQVTQELTIKTPDIVPTWKLRTKPGSEQWGYLFRRPMRDGYQFERLVKSCIAAEMSDPGATGRVRLARLPGSKPVGKLHRAEMVFTDWSRVFEPDAGLMTRAFGVALVGDSSEPVRTAITADGAVVGEDELLLWLSDNGYALGGINATGWVPIRCPWSHEHSDGDLTGTYYKPAGVTDLKRAFKCNHSCNTRGRDTRSFLEEVTVLGAPRVPPVMLPKTGSVPVPEHLSGADNLKNILKVERL